MFRCFRAILLKIREPTAQLELIKNISEEKMRHKYLSILRYKDDVSWSSPTSRVVDNVLTEALRKCL